MAKDFSSMEDSNRSSNPSIHDVSLPSRRTVLRGGLGMTLTGLPLLGFKSVPVSTADAIAVPEGYIAEVIAAWGEPVGLSGEMPAFKDDATNTAADQEAQMGMHHDGIHFFAQDGSKSGLLVMNHEYVDDGLLHADGLKTWTAEKVRKAQAAHGVAVIEVEQKDGAGRWCAPRPGRGASPRARP
jgi:secreted PhoX family phosphatase